MLIKTSISIRISLTAMALCLLCTEAISQFAYDWGGSYGSANMEEANDMCIDSDGNAYVTGAFAGTVDFDPSPATFNLTSNGGSLDIYVAKYDVAGNLVWAKTIGVTPNEDRAYKIVADNQGHIYVGGAFAYGGDTADFDPGPGVANLTTTGNFDAYIAKYDTDLNYIWAKNMASQNNDHLSSIGVDDDLNVYIGVTYSQIGVDFDPGPGVASLGLVSPWESALAKYDVNGNFVWVKNLLAGSGWEWSADMAFDAQQNVYVVSHFSDTADFDPGSGTDNHSAGPNSFDVSIQKLDPQGNYIWGAQLGGNGDDVGPAIEMNATDDAFYVVSRLTPGGNLESGNNNNTSFGNNGQMDIWLGKLDLDGNLIWGNTAGGNLDEFTTDLTLDDCENVYICGGIASASVDMDWGTSSFILSSQGGFDGFVSKYTKDGCFLDAFSAGNTNDGYFSGANLFPQDNTLRIAGLFVGTADFDPQSPIANETVVGGGGNDVVVASYTQGGIVVPAPTVLDNSIEVCQGQDVLCIANPSNCAIKNWFNVPNGGTTIETGDTLAVLNVQQNQTFYVEQALCSTTSIRVPVNIIVSTSTPYNNPVSICAGQVYNFNGNSYSVAGSYSDTLQTALGCDSIVNTILSLAPSPDAGFEIGGTPDCNDLCYQVIYTGATQQSDMASINWDSGNANSSQILEPSFCYVVSGLYIVHLSITNNLGCIATQTDSLLVTVPPPGNIYPNTQSICDGEYYTVNGNNYSIDGTYFDSLQTIHGCDSIVKTILTVLPLPDVAISQSTIDICDTLCYRFSYSGSAAPGSIFNYAWFFDNGAPLLGDSIEYCFGNTDNHEVTLSMMDMNGCSASATLEVDFNSVVYPQSIFEYSMVPYNNENSITVENLSQDATEYWWRVTYGSEEDSNTDFEPQFVVAQEAYYCIQLAVASAAGCIDTSYVCFDYPINEDFYMPNAFTPDNDGVNDQFFPVFSIEPSDYEFSIYNRYGEKIYATTDPSEVWTGNTNGGKYFVPNGVYEWQLKYKNRSNEVFQKMGHLTLVR
jgi:gliding motility-associated-like protein